MTMASLSQTQGMPGIVQPNTQPSTQLRIKQGKSEKYIFSMVHVISISYITLIAVNYRESAPKAQTFYSYHSIV